MWKTILDSVFPVVCLGCGRQESFVCPNCFKQIPIRQDATLKQPPKKNLSELLVVSYYQNPLLKKIIHNYKYNFIKQLSLPLASLILLSPAIKSIKENPENFLIIPVPLAKKRLKWRGFNQSEIIVEILNKKLNVTWRNNILIRHKKTSPQVNLDNFRDRKKNLQNAFSLNLKKTDKLKLDNKIIILFDDISTSGTTLEECARTLKPLKPKAVKGLVLARGK